MSYADFVFIETCKQILSAGITDNALEVRPKWEDGTPAHTVHLNHVVARYDLSQGLPIMTMRKSAWKNAIREMLWIWQKKSNNIADLGMHIWDAWADENGTIGKAYGYQLGRKIQFPEGEMDQVDWIIKTLKENPGSRRMVTNIFNHDDLKDMGLQPCAYSMTFNVTIDPKTGEKVLHSMLNQRSQDMLTANNWNAVQYSALTMMLAQVSGMKPGIFTHVIADAHIYDRHVPIVQDMISRYEGFIKNIHTVIPDPFHMTLEDIQGCINKAQEEIYQLPHPNPVSALNPHVTDFYQFTPDDFEVVGYMYEPFDYKIPVAE